MSKREFMEELEVLLEELPKDEKEEAIRYYDSYFAEAGEENEQTVLNELGSAGRVAAQILRDFRAEKGTGFYTERGYQEQEEEKEMPGEYRQATSDGSGVHVTKKGLSGIGLVAVILLVVLTFPIWVSVLATAFGLLVGLIFGGGGILIGFGIGGIACLFGGIVTLFAAVIKLFTVPIAGVAMFAAALLIFGIGCLMLAAVYALARLGIWLVKTLTEWFGRLFHRNSRGTSAQ